MMRCHHLSAMLDDSRHNVLYVGDQAKGTPGHRIQTYGPKGGYVDLDGERIDIRAGITSIGGYSAHADQKGTVGIRDRDGAMADRDTGGAWGEKAKRRLSSVLRQQYTDTDKPLALHT